MHFLGEDVTNEDVHSMIAEADADRDGKIDFEGEMPQAWTQNIDTPKFATISDFAGVLKYLTFSKMIVVESCINEGS